MSLSHLCAVIIFYCYIVDVYICKAIGAHLHRRFSFTDLSFLGEATKVPQVAGLPELPKVPKGHITIGLMTWVTLLDDGETLPPR